MVCCVRSGNTVYSKIMKFIIQNVMLFNYSIFHILQISVNIFQKWFAVVCSGLWWFAVVCGNSTVPAPTDLNNMSLVVSTEDGKSAQVDIPVDLLLILGKL